MEQVKIDKRNEILTSIYPLIVKIVSDFCNKLAFNSNLKDDMIAQVLSEVITMPYDPFKTLPTTYYGNCALLRCYTYLDKYYNNKDNNNVKLESVCNKEGEQIQFEDQRSINPQEGVELLDNIDWINERMELLTSEQKKVILSLFYEDKSLESIAIEIGTSSENIRNIKKAALEVLKSGFKSKSKQVLTARGIKPLNLELTDIEQKVLLSAEKISQERERFKKESEAEYGMSIKQIRAKRRMELGIPLTDEDNKCLKYINTLPSNKDIAESMGMDLVKWTNIKCIAQKKIKLKKEQ